MTEAEKILSPTLDRTPRERRDMCDFYAATFDWGKDMIAYSFEDGSQIMMTLDENLQPTEMLIV